MSDSPKSPLVDLNCACAGIRRTARLVTQLYSHEMDSTVEPAQFSLLTVLNHRPGATQSAIGRALGLDKTTTSRNLRLIQQYGWIEPAPTDDHRERGYRLSPSGRRLLAAAKPGWQRAQRKLRAALKPGEWEAMFDVINRVAAASLAAQQD
ncbi:MAG: transcriptional regulator, MarR family [Candidatus Solibacter sp.]|nr:transcriptional regulator, MarR family [Candidatus Solibacter sp.]